MLIILLNLLLYLNQSNENKFEYIIDNNTIVNIFLKNINIQDKENILMIVSEIDITYLSMREKEILFFFRKCLPFVNVS